MENISKNFKNVKAVDNLSVTIKDGELVSFLGPSGCGKSTTLFILAGLYNQDKGSIYFDDEIVDNIGTEKRNIGMVFQNYALYPHMTVLKNIMFSLEMNKVPKKEAEKRVDELVELLKIEGLKERKPSQLSGGQQQRVAIARALIKKPKVLLMDEPLSNLDAKLRIETREEIRKLQQHLGITTIFVTHDQDEAASISDRILIMNDGRLQQFDKPREIYNNPNNLFTAKFMGRNLMNIFKIKKTATNFLIEGASQFLKNVFKLDNLEEKEFYLGIRPEDFQICEPGTGNLEGVVEQVEMQGRDNLVIFTIGNLKCRCHSSPELSLKIKEKIGLKFNKDKILVFHIENGKNLLVKGI